MSKDTPVFKKYVPDDRAERVYRELPLPLDRPSTRREIWEHYHALYFDFKGHQPTPLCTPRCNHRNPGELETYCRDAWAWSYISRVLNGWDKHPDWTEGEPVIHEAVASIQDFPAGAWGQCIRTFQACYDTARLRAERIAA